MTTTQTIWRKLTSDDTLRCGDFFSEEDPNTPEKQTGEGYNLQMQAVSTKHWGMNPSGSYAKPLGNRGYWRPVGFRKVESVYFDDPRA